MPPEVTERAVGQLSGVVCVKAYGLAETSGAIALLPPDEHPTASRPPGTR